MTKLIPFLKCIADDTRFKILILLLGRRLCVCELTAVLEKSQPCISQHLRRFKDLNLVVEEREEQWVYYQINKDVFNSYLKSLNNLKSSTFSEKGFEKLEKKLAEVKAKNLCNVKSD